MTILAVRAILVRMTTADLELRRVYPVARGEVVPRGRVYLVDRLWPRGVRREALRLDAWLREAAPSAELRRWFGHDPARWDGFVAAYTAELDDRPEPVRTVTDALAAGPVTLLYAARDTRYNHAVVLRDYVLGRGTGAGER